ncbi:hypothetical protein RND81_05G203800 [Saponaria officinalis]
MTTVDAQQHKVIVNGNIDADTLLKKLSKAGKPAELWPNASGKKEKLPEPQQVKDGGDPKPNKGGKKGNPKSSDEAGLKTQTSLPADKLDIPQNDPNAPSIDGGKPPEIEKVDQIDGNNADGNVGKKKKKGKGSAQGQGQGQDGNSVISGNTAPPPPAPTNGQEGNPVINENPAPPQSLPEIPSPAAAPIPVQADAPAAGAPEPAQAPVMPPMGQNRPMEPINHGPPNHQGLPYGPCHGPGNDFGPMNHPIEQFPRPHMPPAQMGVSYSMAQPSSSASYYTPPYYAYAYPPHPMMHAPPRPPPPPRYIYDDYNNDDDNNASQCRLM